MTNETVRLMSRLNDTEPKCATCAFWQAELRGDDAPSITAAKCNRNDVKTLDLQVCTGWHSRETDQEVL